MQEILSGTLGLAAVEQQAQILEEDVITERLSRIRSQENVIILHWGPDIALELENLAASKHLHDAVIVDATECGLLFPAEILAEVARLCNSLLEVQGGIVFITADKALALVRETLAGSLSFHIFDNHAELFDYSPPLAKHVQSFLGKTGMLEESTDLSQQVLMSTVPILTALGIKIKANIESHRRSNAVITAVDNYTPLSTISQHLASQGKMSHEELLDELRDLEKRKAIYPVFPKIPFLVSCFRNKTPFTLKDYFLSSQLVTTEQLDQMALELQKMPVKERITIGPLSVKMGFVNSRQLEVALQDQAFYGQPGDTNEIKLVQPSGEQPQVQSLVGHLGTIDPSNLLQNLCTNRESGVLSVEYKDMQFRGHFEVGKLTHAKVGKITGNKAVLEFAAAWHDGIFVFIQRTPPPDLTNENCKLVKPLEKLLLDAALAQDNTQVILKKLPRGMNSVLEKVPDSDNLLDRGHLVDPQEKTPPLNERDLALIKQVWNSLDGLTPLSAVIRYIGDATTYEVAHAVDILLHHKLAIIPGIELTSPLHKFQQLVRSISEKIDAQLNVALLRLALRDVMGYSGKARVFVISGNGEIGVDRAAARQANASLTIVNEELQNWQVKYIEYISQEMDRDQLTTLIKDIHSA